MCAGRGLISDLPSVAPGYPPQNGSLWTVKSVGAGVQELTEPCGTDGLAAVGPYGLFGWLVQQQTGRQTLVINAGVGGSRSDQWVSGSSFLNNALARLGYALSRNNHHFRGICVYSGLNDAAFSETPSWAANTQNMLAAIRGYAGKTADQCPAIISRLPVEVPTDVPYPGHAYVQSQIESILDANHIGVHAPTATKENYHLHHKTEEAFVHAQRDLVAAMSHPTWS